MYLVGAEVVVRHALTSFICVKLNTRSTRWMVHLITLYENCISLTLGHQYVYTVYVLCVGCVCVCRVSP